MRKAKTHEQYVKELKDKRPDIEVLGEYNGSKMNIVINKI